MHDQTVQTLGLTTLYSLQACSTGLLVVGTFSNILLLATLRYKSALARLQSTPVNGRRHRVPRCCPTQALTGPDLLLVTLTAADLVSLWTLVVRYTVALATDYDIRASGRVACKLHTFVCMLASNWSLAVLCVLSTHRAVSLVWPLQARVWLSRHRLRVSLMLCAGLIVAKHVPALIGFDLRPFTRIRRQAGTALNADDDDDDGGEIEPFGSLMSAMQLSSSRPLTCDLDSSGSLAKVYYWLEFTTHAVLGHAWLVSFNVFMFSVLLYRRLTRNRVALERRSGRSTRGQLRSVMVVLTLSCLQLVTSFPFFLLIELADFMKWTLVPRSQKVLFYYVSVLAIYTNNVANYIILLVFSPTCRKLTGAMIKNWILCGLTGSKAKR